MTESSTGPTAMAPSTPVGLVDVLWLAAASAVFAACGHVSYTETRLRLLHQFTWTSKEFAWLALVGYLVCALVVAVPVGAVVVSLRRWFGLRFAATVFGTLAIFALLLLWQRIHPLAQLALALGVGTQFAARLVDRRQRWYRAVKRFTVAGSLALGITGALTGGLLRSASSGAGSVSAPPDAPNIVLLILDTVRAANLSLYGYERRTTPVLDALAQESTVFDLAFATAPWTAPSHASMMTGVWASQAGADYLNRMHDTLTTVAQVLGRRGYVTGGFMANAGYAGYQLGISRGFTHYEDFPFNFRQAMWSTTLTQTGSGRRIVEGIVSREWWKLRRAITNPDLRTVTVRESDPQTGGDIADHFFAWRDGVRGAPYFAMLNFMDAHAPYEAPGSFRTRFNDGKRELDRYDGGIAFEDSVIGTIVQRLKERGELDRTVLIVTADHGEQWGEHGLDSHGNSLYLPLLHVPLLVRAPGRAPAGRRVQAMVSLRDIASTLVELAGAPPGVVPGTSLSSAWRTGSNIGLSPVMAEAAAVVNPSPRNLTRFGPMKAVIDSTGHYIHYGNGKEQLFAWRLDSAELNDVASANESAGAIAAYRTLIGRLLGTGWPPPRAGQH